MTKKEIVTAFLEMCARGESPAAFKKFAHPEFRHHNAYFKGDAETLIRAMEENAKQYPRKLMRFHHVIGEQNLVAVHSHIRMNEGDRGAAAMHIFRFKDEKILELWDFAQAVPEKPVNENGMF